MDPFSFVDPISEESEPGEVLIPVKEDVEPFFVLPKYIGDEADADGEWVAVDYEKSLSKIFAVLGEI